MSERARLAGRILPLIDLTNLNDGCTAADIAELCRNAITGHGPVAAVCVYPAFVAQSVAALAGGPVKVATVVNFPAGGTDQRAVLRETKQAVGEGVHEVDLVLPYRALASGDAAAAEAMVSMVRAATEGTALLKVIVEAGELKEPALIRKASDLALEAGADFIKTSTGKVAVNATPEAARIMLEAIRDAGDRGRGFKAAGGIRTVDDAGTYLALADEIMGEGWATPSTFRFGASSLLGDVLAALGGEAAPEGEGY